MQTPASAIDDSYFFRLAHDLAASGDTKTVERFIMQNLCDPCVSRGAILSVAATYGVVSALDHVWQNAEFSMAEGRLVVSRAAAGGQAEALRYILDKGVSPVWLVKDLPSYPENIVAYIAANVPLPATRHKVPTLVSLTRDGLPGWAILAILRRQGYTVQATAIEATGMLEKLSVEDRVKLIQNVLQGTEALPAIEQHANHG